MELAKSLNAADVYVPLSRSDPTPQWGQIKKDNPYGFDIGKLLPNASPPIMELDDQSSVWYSILTITAK